MSTELELKIAARSIDVGSEYRRLYDAIEDVAQHGGELVITRYGKRMKLVPADPEHPREYETVRVSVTIEPRSTHYSEEVELEIPAGLTGTARENAIIAAPEDIVNNECPWGAAEV